MDTLKIFTLGSNWWPWDGVKGSITIRFLRERGDLGWRVIECVLVEFILRVGFFFIKCEACQAFYCFFASRLINSIIQEHECQILFSIWHWNYIDILFLKWKCYDFVIMVSCNNFTKYVNSTFKKYIGIQTSKHIEKVLNVVYQFHYLALYHSQAQCHVIKINRRNII